MVAITTEKCNRQKDCFLTKCSFQVLIILTFVGTVSETWSRNSYIHAHFENMTFDGERCHNFLKGQVKIWLKTITSNQGNFWAFKLPPSFRSFWGGGN